MPAVDVLIYAIKATVFDAQVRQLQPALPGDDTGLWFVTDSKSTVEVNVETHDGEFPFLIENSRNNTRVTTTDIEETLAALRWTLGRYQSQDSSAA